MPTARSRLARSRSRSASIWASSCSLIWVVSALVTIETLNSVTKCEWVTSPPQFKPVIGSIKA